MLPRGNHREIWNMWSRFAESLHCWKCQQQLQLEPLERRTARPARELIAQGEQLGFTSAQLTSAVETGLLLCASCKLWFPIFHGLPILLPYLTGTHQEFLAEHGAAVKRLDHPL
jgi:uncharacterized protein YbaR (Trm112 family)